MKSYFKGLILLLIRCLLCVGVTAVVLGLLVDIPVCRLVRQRRTVRGHLTKFESGETYLENDMLANSRCSPY